jgi:3-hydroxybutyryl-CoA dehydratase
MNNIPKTLTFENISIGYSDEFSVTVDSKMLESFANISGDFNPLHMDPVYAEQTPFKKQVCHGMLLASFFSKLLGMHIPGKNALYFSQSLNFRAPCFVNDTVTVKGVVIEKRETTKMITIKTEIINQDSVCVIDGIAKVIVRE